MKQTLTIQDFSGGTATSRKKGIAHSAAFTQSLDFRKDPNLLTVLPATVKESGGTITDLPLDMCRTSNGDSWVVGNTGKIYRRTSAGVWSLFGTLGENSGGSIVYRQDIDVIYITGQTKVGLISKATTSPSLNANQYAQNLDTTAVTGGAQVYSAPTTISEASVDQFTYTPNIEPLYSVKLYVVTKGTADLTLTMHDDQNTVLGTVTLATANITAGQLNEFIFSTSPRMLVKPNARTYHFHLTGSVAGTTVQTETASSFANPNREIYGARLVTTRNGWHPAALYQQYLVIGNERYLTAFEPLAEPPLNSSWERHKVTLPAGYEICGVSQFDQFLTMGAEKKSSSTSADFQDGKIFYWDGASTTYNDFIDIPEGSPQSIFTHKKFMFYFAAGGWWVNSGKNPVRLRQMPGTDSEFTGSSTYITSYPNMMTVRNSILLAGFPSETNKTDLKHAVYSFGKRDKDHPDSFGLSYPISTGTLLNTNNLRIGMIKSFNDVLFIGWRDGTNYGMDTVSNASIPFGTFSYETLIFDAGASWKQKAAVDLMVTFPTVLPSGVTITLKYKIDRESSWQMGTGSAIATTGDTMAKLSFPAARRFREIELGFDGVSTSSTTPEINSLSFGYDDLRTEQRRDNV